MEGSANVDEVVSPTSTDDVVDTTDSKEVVEDSGVSQETDKTSDEDQDEKPKLTEKGTKLDSNPVSAAYQQLANERRIRQDYERVLQSPELLRKYAKESGFSLAEAKEEIKDQVRKFSPDTFKTADDVATAFNSLNERLESLAKENYELKNNFSGLSESREIERVANSLQSDAVKIKSSYDELNPKSDSYNKALDEKIARFYHQIDFDPQTNGYRGNHSLADVAKEFVETYREAKGTGSKEAQTKIVEKKTGRVITSTQGVTKEVSESSDPGTAIAQRIAKALNNR